MADAEAAKRFTQFVRMMGGDPQQVQQTPSYQQYLSLISMEECETMAAKSTLLAITTVTGMMHNGMFVPGDADRAHALAEVLDMVRGAE